MNLKKLFTCFSNDLAIDLGTANTLVYARGSGVVINEPSVVAINKTTRKIEAVGKDAREALGRTPGDIVAVEPLREGVIADLEIAEQMLLYFIQQAHRGKRLVRSNVVIGVPGQANVVERRAVEEAAYRARANNVYLAPEAMAAAIGAGLPIDEPVASMVVDIGGGTTDIAVLSLSGIVHSQEVRVAGKSFDEAIIEHIKRKRRLLIGPLTAERIKIELGSAVPPDASHSMEVSGRCLKEGLPKTITVTDKEIYDALANPLNIIVNTVREALAHIPPELSGDIIDRGVTLTGGGGLLRNLDRRLMEETGVPVTVDQDALYSVVLGASRMLNDAHLLGHSK